jgi:hypothetical protein
VLRREAKSRRALACVEFLPACSVEITRLSRSRLATRFSSLDILAGPTSCGLGEGKMKTTFVARLLVVSGALTMGIGAGYTDCASASNILQAPDNTANNKQQNPTADQQKETPADRALAQKIRHAIVDDSSLSSSAHNVKIIVRDGVVVLKGPVQSEDEKKSIGEKAAEIAGAGKVKNLLTINNS